MSLLASALLATAASSALPGDLPTTIGHLQGALDARLDEIGPVPDSKAEKREQWGLTKAAVTLSDYEGHNETDDFRVVGRTGGFVRKSSTNDFEVRAAVEAAVHSLGDLVAAEGDEVADVLDLLAVVKYRAKVAKILARGQSLLARGRDRIAADPARAERLIEKARRMFRKATRKGQRFLEAGGGALPPGVTVSGPDLLVRNDSATVYYLRDISISGGFRNDLTGDVTLTATGVSMDDSYVPGFPGTIGRGTVASLGSYLKEYRWRLTPFEYYSTDAHTFEGTLTLFVSRNRSPKRGEAVWTIVLEH